MRGSLCQTLRRMDPDRESNSGVIVHCIHEFIALNSFVNLIESSRTIYN